MRHNKKFNHLGRTASHRASLLANMASSLIMHKRITTTLAKAKALKKYVEPLITRSKNDTTTSRRVVFRYLQDKYAVKELFGDVAAKVADRPGGYTRFIELVDFDENMAKTPKVEKKTRRSRSKKATTASATDATTTVAADAAPATEAENTATGAATTATKAAATKATDATSEVETPNNPEEAKAE